MSLYIRFERVARSLCRKEGTVSNLLSLLSCVKIDPINKSPVMLDILFLVLILS